MNKVLNFFKEVKAELFKVTWPGRDDLIGTVIIVCLVTIVCAIILGGMDVAFGYLIRKLIS